MNLTWQDLSFFLTHLKNLPVSKSINLGDGGGFCVSTGCSLESWVFYPERIKNSEVVELAIKFFKENKISFMWPLYDGGEKILEDYGLIYAGSLTGMVYNSPLNFKEINCRQNPTSEDWAQTVWRGFGGKLEEIPKNYYDFAEALNKEPAFTIAAYTNGDKDKHAGYCGGYLLANEPGATGVYYFSTVPEMRRQGIARAMMNIICSFSKGRQILLQATPAGLPFYKNFGFTELCKIPVYSDASDVF